MRAGIIAAAALALVVGGRAHADANLVSNPGFEADAAAVASVGVVTPPTDWTVGGSGDAGADATIPNNGAVDAFLGDGTLSQTLATVSGTSYDISFWVAVDETTYNDPFATFDATFGSTDLFAGTPLSPSSLPGVDQYQEETATVLATSSSTMLTFAGSTTGDAGDWYLDDVSVVAATPPLGVPEPASALLLATGLVAAVTRLRRR